VNSYQLKLGSNDNCFSTTSCQLTRKVPSKEDECIANQTAALIELSVKLLLWFCQLLTDGRIH